MHLQTMELVGSLVPLHLGLLAVLHLITLGEFMREPPGEYTDSIQSMKIRLLAVLLGEERQQRMA
ncbi:hypothetical protein B9G79_00330 [Bdellovibrio bacteriovorus]|uniref:Uncharacterized protein n=1 Tax=Bdellovibrio bacteriovorus TaxID=959 RepID=A0A1Z3N415_BDEBC|nr:hypothetical protein B9G79_00330 [Bdellovibrio bacteriovorus]